MIYVFSVFSGERGKASFFFFVSKNERPPSMNSKANKLSVVFGLFRRFPHLSAKPDGGKPYLCRKQIKNEIQAEQIRR